MKQIKTKAEYKKKLKTLEKLMDGNPSGGTVRGKRLKAIAELIMVYEDIHFFGSRKVKE